MLRALDEASFGLLKWNMAQGVYSTSNYSGTGFFEMSMHLTAEALRVEFSEPAHVHTVSATEKMPLGRKSLASFGSPWAFNHIFGDMFGQLEPEVRQQFKEIEDLWPTKDVLQSQSPQETTKLVKQLMMQMIRTLEQHDFAEATSKCLLHGCRPCPIADIPEDT
jgi:hypothetical protein